MQMTTATPITCQHCGRPIRGMTVSIGGFPYHYECTIPPDGQATYQPRPHSPGATPLQQLTEEDVRRIAREEIADRLRGLNLGGLVRYGSN